MMFHNIRILISRSTIPTYSIGFFLLVIMIGLGLYLIDARYKSLEETIDNQLSVNSIMNNLTGISEQRGKIMLLLLNEDDPFNRDDLIQ